MENLISVDSFRFENTEISVGLFGFSVQHFWKEQKRRVGKVKREGERMREQPQN